MKFPIAWLLGSMVLLCRNSGIVVLAADENNKIIGGAPVAAGAYPYHCVSTSTTFLCGCR
jgi:hypothetical protein